MNIADKLYILMEKYNWSENDLTEKCGLEKSVITNALYENDSLSISDLDKICSSCNITLSEFFAQYEMINLTPQQKELFYSWRILTAQQKDIILKIMKEFRKSSK